MARFMVAGGPLDHAFAQCPHFQREQHEAPENVCFFDMEAEHGLSIEYPWETRPFGMCGWCWRVYVARRPLLKALIKYGAWEFEPESHFLNALDLSHHVPGAEQPAYWGGRIVSP